MSSPVEASVKASRVSGLHRSFHGIGHYHYTFHEGAAGDSPRISAKTSVRDCSTEGSMEVPRRSAECRRVQRSPRKFHEVCPQNQGVRPGFHGRSKKHPCNSVEFHGLQWSFPWKNQMVKLIHPPATHNHHARISPSTVPPATLLPCIVLTPSANTSLTHQHFHYSLRRSTSYILAVH